MPTAWETYKLEIESRLKSDPMRVYGRIQGVRDADAGSDPGWHMGFCPFHRNTDTPAFAFNSEHLGWVCFSNHGCGKGDVWDFITRTSGQTFKEAIVTLGDEMGLTRPSGMEWVNRPPIDREVIDLFVSQLWEHDDPTILKYLREKRGLTDDTIRARRIGWSKKHERYTLPVLDEKGLCWNVRLYSPASKKKKMLNFQTKTSSYGTPPRVYGIDLLAAEKNSLVMLCEGEWDSIVATQAGITAVSGTHGCAVFEEQWVEQYFRGRDVAICYDCDEEGKRAVTDLLLPLFAPHVKSGTVKSVKVVTLPLAGTKADKDVTDWIVKRSCEPVQFKKLIFDTPVHEFTEADQGPIKREQFDRLEEIAKEPPIPIGSFTEVDRTDLIGRRVACDITVCGETSESFFAVEQFRVQFCPEKNSGKCALCQDAITVPHGARDFIGSCMATDAQVAAMLARNYCPRGQKPAVEILKKRVVREFFCHQRVNRVTNTIAGTQDTQSGNQKLPQDERLAQEDVSLLQLVIKPHDAVEKAKKAEQDKLQENNDKNRAWDAGRNEELVEKRVYYLSDSPVKHGHYRAEGWVIDRPQTQHSSFLIEKLEPQEDDYESFRVADHLDELRALKEIPFTEILDDLRENVTRVYERDELLLGILLAYLSPRFFQFNGEMLRGWVCMAVIGDVGTAKTKTYTNLARWLNVGDVFSSLTGSRTGLAYALHQSQRGWNCRIGRYPANSRKLLMIDEVQVLPHEDLKSITKAMDEGIMQVDRVESKSYESQTRAIFIGNPRTPTMDHHQFGCQALKQVFPIMMLRRLDFVILANQHDVKNVGGLLQKMRTAPPAQRVTAGMLRALNFLMWNIQPDKITFTPDAIDACMAASARLSEKFGYASGIPLITQYEADKKVARLSVGMAAFNVSFNDDFTNLTVLPRHVQLIEHFLDVDYSAENFQLDAYSKRMRAQNDVEDYDKIVFSLDQAEVNEQKHNDDKNIRKLLYTLYSFNADAGNGVNGDQKALSRNDIADATGMSRDHIPAKMRILKAFNLVGSGRNGYFPTPKLSRFLRRIINDRPDYFDDVSNVLNDAERNEINVSGAPV